MSSVPSELFDSPDERPATEQPGGWEMDPFYDPGLDDSGDAELADLWERSYATSGYESVSSLSALSTQMDTYRPLEPDEQADRIRWYNEGLAAEAKLASGSRISPRERDKLLQVVQRGEQAQTELVGSMFRLVLLMAREQAAHRYGRERCLELLPDLVAEANVALVEAITKFDTRRGLAFNKYAARVVRERIRAQVSQTSLVGVPASWLRLRALATTLKPEMAMKLGRPATVEEMQEELRRVCMEWARNHLTDEQAKLPPAEQQIVMEKKLVKQGMLGAIGKYEEVMVNTQSVQALDAVVGEGSTTFGELLSAPDSDATFDAAELSSMRENVLKALEELTEREREILMYRYGFLGESEEWTYAKLAPKFNVSSERVRQIEASALAKLRGPGFELLQGFFA